MLTRRIILDTTAYFIAVCLAANRLATAGSAAADDASALAFISAIYNSYTPDGADPVRIDTGRKLRRYFEPALAEAMNKDQENAAKHHDEGKLGSDPFIDSGLGFQTLRRRHQRHRTRQSDRNGDVRQFRQAGDDRARSDRDQKRLADL